jgi:hypothetical protein
VKQEAFELSRPDETPFALFTVGDRVRVVSGLPVAGRPVATSKRQEAFSPSIRLLPSPQLAAGAEELN